MLNLLLLMEEKNFNFGIFAPMLQPCLLNLMIEFPSDVQFFEKVSEVCITCTKNSSYKHFVIKDGFNRL
jgi:hypothetical protein